MGVARNELEKQKASKCQQDFARVSFAYRQQLMEAWSSLRDDDSISVGHCEAAGRILIGPGVDAFSRQLVGHEDAPW